MKLLGYEFWKCLNKKFILIFIPLLLLANGWLYFYEQHNEHRVIIENVEQYYIFEKVYANKSISEAYEIAKKIKKSYLCMLCYQQFVHLNQMNIFIHGY